MAVQLLGAVGFLLMLLTSYLYFDYSDTHPTEIDRKTGHTLPLNVHGRIVYLTEKENLALNVIRGMTVGVIISFAVLVRYRPRRQRDLSERH